jgi:hypothetical protein
MAPPRPPARGRPPLFPMILVGILVIAGGVWASSPLWRSTIGAKTDDDTPGVTFLVPPATTARATHAVTDPPDPGALYRGASPSNPESRERRVGGPPARFDGYSTSVASVTRVPAATVVKGSSGSYLRVDVRVVNQSAKSGEVCRCDFSVWTHAAGRRGAANVKTATLGAASTLPAGARREGDVYLYVGTTPGPYYVVYEPHTTSTSAQPNGVWQVPQ